MLQQKSFGHQSWLCVSLAWCTTWSLTLLRDTLMLVSVSLVDGVFVVQVLCVTSYKLWSCVDVTETCTRQAICGQLVISETVLCLIVLLMAKCRQQLLLDSRPSHNVTIQSTSIWGIHGDIRQLECTLSKTDHHPKSLLRLTEKRFAHTGLFAAAPQQHVKLVS